MKVASFDSTEGYLLPSLSPTEPFLQMRQDAALGSVGNSMFLANMSHEIRTPMNTILGYAQILSREADLGSTHKKNLESIILSARHLLSLINDVLDISKIESGRMEVIESEFDTYGLFRTVDAVARNKLMCENLEFEIQIDERVPQYVRADECKLRQIIVNLVSNAIKYSESGKVLVFVTMTEEEELSVNVSDTGAGISAEDLEKIFMPFERGDSDSGNQEGTGLGLAISRQFANLLGGSLTAVSTLGIGSEFMLSVPVGSVKERVDRVAIGGQVIGLASPVLRILVVDDNIENATLSSQFLSSIGFDVEVVYNGLDAVEKCESWKPQLVLMDKKMPEVDGLEATRAIRRLEDGKEVVVIVVSASAFQEDCDECLNSGADSYIRKPYLEDDLLKEISRLTGVKYQYEIPDADDEDDVDEAPLCVSDSLMNEFESAILAGDIDKTLDLIDEAGAGRTATKQLRGLALQYKYEQLMKVIKDATTHT